MINILYLHGSADQYGADVVLYELLKGLNKNIFKPYVILPINGPLVGKIEELGISVEINPYPVARRQYFTLLGIISYFTKYYFATKHLRNFCIDKDIRIIHSNTIAVLEGFRLSKKLGLVHVWHIHEMLDRPKIIYNMFSYFITKLGGNIVFVSNSVKEHWLKQKKLKSCQSKVIYNGIDQIRFNPNNETDYLKKELGIKKNDIIVGMIGRVNAIKGQEVFIRAMEIVIEKNPNIKAALIGGVFKGQEWRFERLERKIHESKYAKNFILENFRIDIQNIHCLFNLLVFPSIQNDSFSTVILEAMASGKAVISFKNGGVVEMIEEGINGLYAEFGDPISLAEKIIFLIENKPIRDIMEKNNIRKQITYFSSKSFCGNFNEFYLNLVKE